MTTKYQVTVPLVVTVEADDDGTLTVVRQGIERDGWPGFFSEAAEATGVFNVDGQFWDEEAGDTGVALFVWNHLRKFSIVRLD